MWYDEGREVLYMGAASNQSRKELRDNIQKAVLPYLVMPEMKSPLDQSGTKGGGKLLMQTSGVPELICWLKFFGWSNRECAAHLTVAPGTIDKYVLTGEFKSLYATRREVMLAKVADLLKDRVLEVMLESLEWKIKALRSEEKKYPTRLKDAIATQLIDWGMDIVRNQGGKGGHSILEAVLERVRTRKAKDGSTIREKVTIKGTPGDGANAFVAETGGGSPWADVEAGPASGTGGAAEAPPRLGSSGDHGGSGESGPKPV